MNYGGTPIKSQSFTEPRVNGRIRAAAIKVVSDDGGLLGVLSVSEAIRLAQEKGLDLVEVSPNTDPPVAKIMDYGKYKYAQKKHQKKNTSTNKSCLKEIKVGVKTEDNDLNHKRNRLLDFLKEGHKVKVTVAFHGREISHKELGHDVMTRLLTGIDGHGKVEKEPKFEGLYLSAIIAAA